MSVSEMLALARGDRLRWNRTVKLVVWVMSWIPFLIAKGAAFGAWGAGDVDVDRERLALTAPGFDPSLEK